MNVALKSRLLALVSAVSLVTLVACADSPTSPTPHGARAPRDTTVAWGDTLLCRSGYEIQGGKVVCNGSL
jgi:hypothetical protein